MTDSSPIRRKVQDILPPSTIYDPADDHETPPGTEPTGTVVMLVVGECERSWAAGTALELSAAWARKGRRIVLADLHLEDPVLHEAIGDENLEGMVDVFFYGASIARSARPVRGRGFYLIPAGTYTADLEGVYHHPRWPKLVSGFQEAGASLVLFTPADGSDLAALAAWTNEVLVLGNLPDPGVLGPLLDAGIPVRAHIVEPRGAGASSTQAAATAPVPGPVREQAREARPAADELHLPPPPVRPARKPRRVAFVLWLLLGVVVLAAVGYVLGRLRPDLLPWPELGAGAAGRDSAAASAVSPPAAVPARPTRLGEPLPFSVQVIAFQSLQAALQRLSVDRERVSQAPVFIAPEEIDGILYYKILAGALPDTAAARQLKEKLVADGVVNEEDAAGSWALIQNTPVAFRLGEYPTAGAATAAADSLLVRKISAYPVAVPYSDSTQRWQVYAGAYRDSASAEAMGRLLSSTGLTPVLTARIGLAKR